MARVRLSTLEHLRLGIACALAGWLLGAGLMYLPLWQRAEYAFFDLFSVYTAPGESRMPIVIVGIDEATSTQLNLRWPYPRDVHAQLVQNLADAGAAVIAFDVQFSEPSTPDEDARFAELIAAAGNVVLASKYEYHDTAAARILMRMDPVPAFTEAGAAVGLTDMKLVGDQVPRLMALENDAFWRVAIRKLVEVMPDAGIVEPGVPEGAMIRYLGPSHSTIPYFSYYQVINADPEIQEYLAGALVLVGRDAGAAADINLALADTFPTPFTMTTGKLMPGVEIHATQIENALLGNMLEPAGKARDLALLSTAMALTLLWLVWWHPWRSALLWAATAAGVVGAAYWLFGRGYCDTGNLADLLRGECVEAGGTPHYLWIACASPLAGMGVALVSHVTGTTLIERRRAGQIRGMFSLYVSPEVVAEMIEHPEKLKLGGDRRELSVIFADLAGFTSLSEKLPPDAVETVVNTYTNTMSAIIKKNRGTVDKYIGDCVMAFWGAPIDDTEHALHALQTAVEMQQAMHALQPRFEELGAPGLAMRIGLNSGPAIVGNMGSDDRLAYTALGDTVNLASRLEGANKAYGTPILAADATREAVGERIPMRLVDRIRVKGKHLPVNVYTPCTDANLVALTGLAWNAFLARDWAAARSRIAMIREIAPDDRLAALLEERTAQCERDPPGEDWDGSVGLEKL